VLPDISHDGPVTVTWTCRSPASSWPPVPDVRDGWIFRPAAVWVLATAGYAWFASGHKPVSEREIKREMERQAARRR